ncbi:MAG: Uncharacterised protein [Flavobacteriia bacterium]|nr:MAG: Uncharacterised protein [Flavobacteriia bacterium]
MDSCRSTFYSRPRTTTARSCRSPIRSSRARPQPTTATTGSFSKPTGSPIRPNGATRRSFGPRICCTCATRRRTNSLMPPTSAWLTNSLKKGASAGVSERMSGSSAWNRSRPFLSMRIWSAHWVTGGSFFTGRNGLETMFHLREDPRTSTAEFRCQRRADTRPPNGTRRLCSYPGKRPGRSSGPCRGAPDGMSSVCARIFRTTGHSIRFLLSRRAPTTVRSQEMWAWSGIRTKTGT